MPYKSFSWSAFDGVLPTQAATPDQTHDQTRPSIYQLSPTSQPSIAQLFMAWAPPAPMSNAPTKMHVPTLSRHTHIADYTPHRTFTQLRRPCADHHGEQETRRHTYTVLRFHLEQAMPVDP